jgi:hypothetical protein
MKEITEKLSKIGLICKEFEEKKLNTRKKIKVYFGYSIKNEYCIVFNIERKSRVLQKDVDELENFVLEVTNVGFKYKKKILVLNAPLCSKAKDKFKNLGWRIII